MPHWTGEGETYAAASCGRDALSPCRKRMTIAVRAPKDKEVTGRLFVPKPNGMGMEILAFKIPARRGEGGREGRFLPGETDALPGNAGPRHAGRGVVPA